MDYQEKAFSSLGDTSKLLISLSTGVIGFAALLLNVKANESTALTPSEPYQLVILAIACVSFVLSITFGLIKQLAVVEELSSATKKFPADVWSDKIVFSFQRQIELFVLGVSVLALYVATRIPNAPVVWIAIGIVAVVLLSLFAWPIYYYIKGSNSK